MSNIDYILDDNTEIINMDLRYNELLIELYILYNEAIKNNDTEKINSFRVKIEELLKQNEQD